MRRMVVDTAPQPVIIGPTVVEEVAQNVRMILTTPKGSVPLDRDFGLNFDLVDQPEPRARLLMEVEIIRQVGRYEPRAKVVQVTWRDNAAEAMDGRLSPLVTIEVDA